MLKKLFIGIIFIITGFTVIAPLIAIISIYKIPGITCSSILGLTAVGILLINFLQNSIHNPSLPVKIERDGIRYYLNITHFDSELYRIEYRDDSGTLAPDIDNTVSDMEYAIKEIEKQLAAGKYNTDPE